MRAHSFPTRRSSDLVYEAAGEEAAAVWAAARTEVDEAIEFARSSPYPDAASALDHVFA